MDQLAKLKNIPHQRKCNGCHETFSSDVLGSDDKNKDFLCIHCNNYPYLIERKNRRAYPTIGKYYSI